MTAKTRTLSLAAAALLSAVAAGCAAGGAAPGASSSVTAAAAPTASVAAPADPDVDRAAVRRTFDEYNRSLLARDFDTVCGFMAPETVTAVQQGARQQGLPAATCQEAFGSVYADGQAAALLDETARGTRIGDVTVDGDRATVTFSALVQGTDTGDLTGRMRRVDGEWRILPNS